MNFIITQLREKKRIPVLLLFFLTTALCITLVALRVHYTSKVTFVFLIWNIFLALVPYGISTLVVVVETRISNRWLLIIPFGCWLCFFPNAPYILTDLLHLRQRPGVPYWYDLALILFFAWNGLMLGYASLLDMQQVISRHFNRLTGWAVAIASLVLASFGIYLGRYLRWNSWDVLSSPQGLLADITDRVVDPMNHLQTYAITVLFSLFLITGYLLVFQFSQAYQKAGVLSRQ